MIVTELVREPSEDNDYRCAYEIKTEKHTLSFYDGEPEDANLNRDFNDIFSITDLLVEAHEAGKRGEDLTFVGGEIDD